MRYKMAAMGFPYLAGLFCASLLDGFPGAAYIIGFAGTAAAVTVFILKSRTAGIVIFSFSAAMLMMSLYSAAVIEPLMKYDGKTVFLTGIVEQTQDPHNDMCSYKINCEINGVETTVSCYAEDVSAGCGDTVSFTARLSDFRDNIEFLEKSYNNSQGVYLKATVVSDMKVIRKSSGFSITESIRGYSREIRRKILLVSPNEEGYLLCSFLGDKSHLSFEQKNNIQRTGLSHLTAVSGIHFTITAHLLMIFLNLFSITKRSRVKFGVLAVMAVVFTVFFDFSVSVIRSAIMLVIYYGAEPLHRKGDTFNSIGAALFIILLFQPYAYCDVGLLLSVSGTIGVGVLTPFVTGKFKLKNKILNSIVFTFTASFFAGVCTMPVALIYYKSIPVISPFVFLIVYPLFFVILTMLLIFALTGGVISFIAEVAALAAKIINTAVNLISQFPYASVPLDYDFVPAVIALGIVFTAAAFLITQKKKYMVRAMFTSLTAIIVFAAVEKYITAKDTLINIYSDGKNCAVLIRSRDYSCAVVSDDSSDLRSQIVTFTQNYFLSQIDILCVLNSNNNYIRPYERLDARVMIMPDEMSVAAGIEDKLSFVRDGSSARIILNSEKPLEISLSSVKEPVPSSDISVLYGYKKKFPQVNGINDKNIIIASDKKYNDTPGIVSAYYNELSFILKPDGRVINNKP